jgi:hypothetical protein
VRAPARDAPNPPAPRDDAHEAGLAACLARRDAAGWRVRADGRLALHLPDGARFLIDADTITRLE